MNERIRELAIKAQVEHCVSHVRLQEFADLILTECLNICEDMGDNGKDGHYCADKIAKTLLDRRLGASAGSDVLQHQPIVKNRPKPPKFMLFLCNIAEKTLDFRRKVRYTKGVGCENKD